MQRREREDQLVERNPSSTRHYFKICQHTGGNQVRGSGTILQSGKGRKERLAKLVSSPTARREKRVVKDCERWVESGGRKNKWKIG